MTGKIVRFADPQALAQGAAKEFVRAAREAIAEHGRFAVALSGGSTPKQTFRILAQEPLRDQVDWEHVQVFFGDERAVPPSHEDSNFRMASVSLLHSVPVPEANVHRMPAERDDRDAAARDYERELARVLGSEPQGAPPSLDLVLLGMGADGHTASLFPHTSALAEADRWVVPNHVPKLDAWRMTFTPVLINAARRVRFLVAGADKAGVLAEVLEGPPDPERLPSQLVRPAPGACVWMLDEAAAAQLRKSDSTP